jgi:predicted RNA binding protein YcfA (HicA-like mRNA interferase family)
MSSHLPVATARQVLSALQRAGFIVDRVRGSHYLLAHPGNPARAVTVPFHGAKDLKPGTLRSIIRQAGLTVEQFRDLL